jgi:hypothetical protein
MTEQTEVSEAETPSPILNEIRERGRKRLAVATNAAAWAIYGNDDEAEITIDPKDVAMSEIVAIRVLTQLKEAGLLDNEPLLGLATTRELLEELKSRGEVGLEGTGPTCEEERKLGAIGEVMLREIPEEVLNYATAKKRPVAGESNNDDDGSDAKKENTE